MTVRTLIVDDSATMRAVLSGLLAHDPEIEIIGMADCPATARTMIKELNPDVLTLDIEMPGMDGLDFLEKIMRLRPMPVVMVSTLTERGSEASIRALELGAFDCRPKPAFREARDGDGGALARIVKQAARSRIRPADLAAGPPANFHPKPDSLIALGASTGGVEALLNVLQSFPENCPPTLIVQHMPATFTRSFATRLDRCCPPRVVLAEDGMPLANGQVAIAPGGDTHLVLAGRQRRCRLIEGPLESGHRPSVDTLFYSIADAGFTTVAGAILTGMGADGAKGLHAMRAAGAHTFGQDEATCVVYGMPGVAQRIGAVAKQLPLGQIAHGLLQVCAA